jgi:hypothetical protein
MQSSWTSRGRQEMRVKSARIRKQLGGKNPLWWETGCHSDDATDDGQCPLLQRLSKSQAVGRVKPPRANHITVSEHACEHQLTFPRI